MTREMYNKFWIARDGDGELFLYNIRPSKNERLKRFTCTLFKNGEWSEEYKLNNKSFPEVTFENSPQKVKLELMKK